MSTIRRTHFIRAAAVISFVAACLWLSYRDTAHSGIQGSGFRRVVSIGRITSFGSIYVNGVEYSTAHAQLSINDQPGTEAQLRVGQIVTLEGSADENGRTGEATDVVFLSDARGPVTDIDVSRKTIEVLGQTVRITRDTLFGADFGAGDLVQSIESLANHPFVEVSAFADAHGDLLATRIERVPADGALQVRGTVAALDRTARTFRINALTVDYGAIAPEGLLQNGAVVTVHGADAVRVNVLEANRITVAPDTSAQAGARGDIQGLITSFTSPREFMVGTQRVTTDAETKFSLHGQPLGTNLPVRVKGVFNASSSLVAEKVTAHPHSSFTVSGYVESIVGYALRVNGVSLNVNEATVYEDKSALKLKTFGLEDLGVGDYVETRVRVEPDSGALAGAVVVRRQPKTKESNTSAATKDKRSKAR